MEYLPFFSILLASVLFSLAFRKFHLPWVLALITAGIVVGPYGFDIVTTNDTINFLSEIGLILLMFMAGLEVKLTSFKKFKKSVLWLSILNAGIPFAAGVGLGFLFGYELIPSLLIGTIFMSSSIAVIIPTLENTGVIHTKLGRSIVSATIIQDVASLLFLSIILQSIDPVTDLPLPSFYLLLAVLLVSFRYGLPKIRALFPHPKRDEKDLFESEVRIIVALLIGVVVTFELLGLHPIIAGFFSGLVLSESIKSKIILDKLRTISYGIFIPTFFVIIGMNTDIGVFLDGRDALLLIAAVVVTSMGTKYISGWLGARLGGFRKKDARTIGIATMPQLSTTLAVVFTAVELELLQEDLITAMVILSIVTTLIAPLLLRLRYA